ncbi:MAG: hypothetical protein GY853_14105 [PVC group bacterium]|nr:hypothetical protein [PVC group bacterium]
MKTAITTLVSSDKFQHYLPLYIYVVRKEYPEYFLKTFITGKINPLVAKALDYLRSQGVRFDEPIEVFKDIKLIDSTANSLRFLTSERYFEGMDNVIYTDADLLLFRNSPTLEQWHIKRMKKMKTCYAGHHGPWRKKYRPEISKAGWRGNFERVSAGFVMVTQQWFKKTRKARKSFLNKAKKGKLGGFREFDEVMLGCIVKSSGLPMPPFRFCKKQRGIHLGDFKKQMSRRFTRKKKMKKCVAPQPVLQFQALEKDPIWVGVLRIMEKCPYLMEIIDNARKRLRRRLKY